MSNVCSNTTGAIAGAKMGALYGSKCTLQRQMHRYQSVIAISLDGCSDIKKTGSYHPIRQLLLLNLVMESHRLFVSRAHVHTAFSDSQRTE